MGLRKLIKFGRSSFVLSLPSAWVERNKLQKGDLIEVIEEPGSLVLQVGKGSGEVKTEINLEINDEKEIKAKIISAYINNFNVINIKSDKMGSLSVKIRDVVSKFMGLEIMEETSSRMVLHDFLDINGLDVRETMRRFDRTLKSMMQDSIEFMQGNDTTDLIFRKEEDLNRLSYFMFKVLKLALKPANLKLLGLSYFDVIKNWELVIFMERIGDKVKRLVRVNSELEDLSKLVDLMKRVYSNYDLVMKAFFMNDCGGSLKITLDKQTVVDQADKLKVEMPFEYHSVIDRVSTMNSYIRSIANSVLRFEFKEGF